MACLHGTPCDPEDFLEFSTKSTRQESFPMPRHRVAKRSCSLTRRDSKQVPSRYVRAVVISWIQWIRQGQFFLDEATDKSCAGRLFLVHQNSQRLFRTSVYDPRRLHFFHCFPYQVVEHEVQICRGLGNKVRWLDLSILVCWFCRSRSSLASLANFST